MADMKRVQSNSEVVKVLVLELLKDGMVYSRNEIVKFIKESSKDAETISEGVITGAIKAMVISNKIECVKRGSYRMASVADTNKTMYDKVKEVLFRCKEELEKSCIVNMLDVSEEEIAVVKKVSNTLKIIEKEINSYEKTVEVEKRKEV